MNTPARLGAFGLGLAAIFAAALGLGRAVGPAPTPAATHAGHDGGGEAAESVRLPAGLQVTEDGYRLSVLTGDLTTGGPRSFAFRIVGPDGNPVTRYRPNHDKDLHLIVVRRDLSGFQHVHPALAADGTWSVPLAVAAPGQYRVFADFRPAGHDRGLTLGADVPAPGDYRPRPLPAAEGSTTVDGYTVTLTGTLRPGASSALKLSVSKAGVPVTDLQPCLGAYGHLVALRDGDLAYLHVHPEDTATAGPAITFHADVPSAGSYRLYLDFKHAGTVRTAEFTAVAGAPLPAASAAATPLPAASAAATSLPAGPAAPGAGHDSGGHSHD